MKKDTGAWSGEARGWGRAAASEVRAEPRWGPAASCDSCLMPLRRQQGCPQPELPFPGWRECSPGLQLSLILSEETHSRGEGPPSPPTLGFLTVLTGPLTH